MLRSGALPAEIEVLELRTIGPELGRDSINAGKLAALIGGLLVLVFMWLSYGLFGLFANVALMLNIILVMALLSILGATLTLPGIAGIVLTIGMAVDANVLVFERIKKEINRNSSIYNSIRIGYEKALSSIVDANVTTMIAAVILFFFGSGPIKGFSVTLGLGIITSVFTALIITRLFIDLYLSFYKPKVLRDINVIERVIQSIKRNRIFRFSNLLSYVSLGAIALSIILFIILGLNDGIDFRGGTMFMVSSPEKVKVSDVRNTLSGSGLGDISISQATNPLETLSAGTLVSKDNIFIIKMEKTEGLNVETKVKSLLQNSVPNIKFLQIESVGSKVSSELVRNGMLAVFFAVISVLVYIWLRFEWQFALGAVVALIHDVILTIGVFSILRYEFNLSIIAALLTIIGYSLNDTVVVFDRVRENLRSFKTLPLNKVLNRSINNTFSRTIMTSVTTLLALFALYFLGGDVIRGFTFAMIWGVLVGTYSSIFVAAKILLILNVKRNWDEQDSKAGTQF